MGKRLISPLGHPSARIERCTLSADGLHSDAPSTPIVSRGGRAVEGSAVGAIRLEWPVVDTAAQAQEIGATHKAP